MHLAHAQLGDFRLYCQGDLQLLFCQNETNLQRIFGTRGAPYQKDAFHDYLVHGQKAAVAPERAGTKAAAHYALGIEPGATVELRLRLAQGANADPCADYASLFSAREREADDFYAELQAEIADEDARRKEMAAFVRDLQVVAKVL